LRFVVGRIIEAARPSASSNGAIVWVGRISGKSSPRKKKKKKQDEGGGRNKKKGGTLRCPTTLKKAGSELETKRVGGKR